MRCLKQRRNCGRFRNANIAPGWFLSRLFPGLFGACGLYAAAVPPILTLEGMLNGPRAQLGQRIAAKMVAKTRAEGYDAVVAHLWRDLVDGKAA